MKNRKLFAIITLVAFMLTMMPLMAFATSASGSSISVDKSSAKVFSAKGETLEFILDLDADVTGDQQVVVFAERNGSLSDSDYISLTKQTGSLTGDTGYLVLTAKQATEGEHTLYVASNTTGTVTLKAYVVKGAGTIGTGDNDTSINQVYNGSNTIIKTAFVGNGCTGKFNAANSEVVFDGTVDRYHDGDKVTTAGQKPSDISYGDKGLITVGKDGAALVETVKVSQDSKEQEIAVQYDGAEANNGVDYYKVSLKVLKGDNKVVGEKVTFSVDKDGATLNKEEETTSATGKVDFKVSATKPGTYTVTVQYGTKSADYKFVFGANDVAKMTIPYTVNGTIAVDNKTTVAATVAAYDNNGNYFDPSTLTINDGKIGNFVAKVVAAPADSSLEDTALDFVYDPNTSDSIYFSFEPDAVGEYTIKVYNTTTGAAATTTIKAAEFGTIDHATISYASSVYSLGEKTPQAVVDVYDTNGVKKSANAKKFSYTGLGVSEFAAANGQITFKDDSKYTGNEIVVSVVANNKYAASTTLTIAAEPAALKFTEATAEVGTEATVKAQVVDVNGNDSAISFPNGYDVTVQSAIITERPEGATVSVNADAFTNSKETFLKKGTSTVKITSNKEGTVKTNVVVKLSNKKPVVRDNKTYAAGEYTFYLSGVATANFGAKAPEKGDGATVTFIIGNTTFVANGATKTADVAPYVANGRTFIPVRAFAEATGAKVEYDAATQVITITGEGLSAQMTIGSNILTVNGQTTVMDTAAAVTAEGRTVLPVRFAGQALGYGFEVAYGANGAVSSVTMFK